MPSRCSTSPREELVMVQARETAQGSLFFLGEALTTSCRVRVGDAVGLGLVLGQRSLPRLRACRGGRGVLRRGRRRVGFPLDASLRAELARVEARDQREARRTAATKVDFSTMKVEA